MCDPFERAMLQYRYLSVIVSEEKKREGLRVEANSVTKTQIKRTQDLELRHVAHENSQPKRNSESRSKNGLPTNVKHVFEHLNQVFSPVASPRMVRNTVSDATEKARFT